MKCSMCDNKKALKAQTKRIKFDSCGLDNVTLEGVACYTCDQCGETYEEIPRPQDLMTAIARALVFKEGLLTPKEVVFLRKYLGYSRTQLSSLLSYSYETLNRIEKDSAQNPVAERFDRTMRVLVCGRLHCSDYELLDAIEHRKLSNVKRMVLSPNKNGWELENAA